MRCRLMPAAWSDARSNAARIAGPVLGQRRHQVGGRVRLGPHPVQDPGQLVVRGDVGAERPGQVGVHGGHRLAQPERLRGEIAADLVGAQVALAHQVPHAGGRHRPALGAVGEELGEQAERGLLAVDRSDELAQRLRDVRRTDRVQRPVDLGVRVRARAPAGGTSSGLPSARTRSRCSTVRRRSPGLLRRCRSRRPASRLARSPSPKSRVLVDGLEQQPGDVRRRTARRRRSGRRRRRWRRAPADPAAARSSRSRSGSGAGRSPSAP